MLTDGIDRAIKIRHSAVVDHVRRIRLRYPSATPDELMAALENKYLAAVTSSGAAFGAAAGAPRVKAPVVCALSVADTVAFFEATALFTLAVAEVRGTPVHDVQRRRMLMQSICFGTGGPGLARSSRRVRHWLLTRYRAHRWILVISMVLPFGIGAAIGAASSRARGRMVVAASRQLLGAVAQLAPALPDVARLTIAAERRPAISAPAPRPARAPNGAGTPNGPVAPVAGKYRALFEYLAARGDGHIEMCFVEIGQLVPGGLPKSSWTQRSWWANSPGRVQAKAWLAANFEVTDVDLAAMTVRFDRRDNVD